MYEDRTDDELSEFKAKFERALEVDPNSPKATARAEALRNIKMELERRSGSPPNYLKTGTQFEESIPNSPPSTAAMDEERQNMLASGVARERRLAMPGSVERYVAESGRDITITPPGLMRRMANKLNDLTGLRPLAERSEQYLGGGQFETEEGGTLPPEEIEAYKEWLTRQKPPGWEEKLESLGVTAAKTGEAGVMGALGAGVAGAIGRSTLPGVIKAASPLLAFEATAPAGAAATTLAEGGGAGEAIRAAGETAAAPAEDLETGAAVLGLPAAHVAAVKGKQAVANKVAQVGHRMYQGPTGQAIETLRANRPELARQERMNLRPGQEGTNQLALEQTENIIGAAEKAHAEKAVPAGRLFESSRDNPSSNLPQGVDPIVDAALSGARLTTGELQYPGLQARIMKILRPALHPGDIRKGLQGLRSEAPSSALRAVPDEIANRPSPQPTPEGAQLESPARQLSPAEQWAAEFPRPGRELERLGPNEFDAVSKVGVEPVGSDTPAGSSARGAIKPAVSPEDNLAAEVRRAREIDLIKAGENYPATTVDKSPLPPRKLSDSYLDDLTPEERQRAVANGAREFDTEAPAADIGSTQAEPSTTVEPKTSVEPGQVFKDTERAGNLTINEAALNDLVIKRREINKIRYKETPGADGNLILLDPEERAHVERVVDAIDAQIDEFARKNPQLAKAVEDFKKANEIYADYVSEVTDLGYPASGPQSSEHILKKELKFGKGKLDAAARQRVAEKFAPTMKAIGEPGNENMEQAMREKRPALATAADAMRVRRADLETRFAGKTNTVPAGVTPPGIAARTGRAAANIVPGVVRALARKYMMSEGQIVDAIRLGGGYPVEYQPKNVGSASVPLSITQAMSKRREEQEKSRKEKP